MIKKKLKRDFVNADGEMNEEKKNWQGKKGTKACRGPVDHH